MITAVYFDVGGVLYSSHASVPDDLHKFLGLPAGWANEYYDYYLPLLGTGKMTETEFWAELRKKYGIRNVDPEEKLISKSFEETLQPMPGMQELVTDLRGRGLKVGLLTNVTPQWGAVHAEQGNYNNYDATVLSYEVGLWKPERAIYELAVLRLGVRAEQAIMVDDLEENIIAAIEVGMTGILFKSAKQLRADISNLL